MRARGKETRQAILRAAEEIFAERGYAGARMDDVAAEVGIKRASMVYYFRDKHSLYVALLQDLYGELMEQYQRRLVAGGTARDRILDILRIWTDHAIARPGSVRILMWESARVRRSPAESVAGEMAPIQNALSELLEEGHRQGTFRSIHPLRFLMIMTGATGFLTLGMDALTRQPSSLTPDELHAELRSLLERILFVD
jgi:TetR/AcrR family transcriptional regulator